MELKIAAEILLSSGFDIWEIDERETYDLSKEDVLKLVTEETKYIVVFDDTDTNFSIGVKSTPLQASDLVLADVIRLVTLRQKLEIAITKLECLWDLSELKNSAIKLVDEFDVNGIKSIFDQNEGLYHEDIEQTIIDVKDNN
jgi:hypothetical protein